MIADRICFFLSSRLSCSTFVALIFHIAEQMSSINLWIYHPRVLFSSFLSLHLAVGSRFSSYCLPYMQLASYKTKPKKAR